MLDQIFKNLNPELNWLPDHSIFLTIHGSKAYGLDTKTSDTDIRGICTTPKQYLFGFQKRFDQYIKNEPDCTIFNIQKFFNLASTGNPNVFELLFIEPEFHLKVSELGQLILDNREYFISKQLKERYIGYAKSQAHRIANHRQWILNPRTKPPTREEFGLKEKPEIDKNQFDTVKALIRKQLDAWNPDFEPFTDSQKIYLQNKVADILSEISITKEDTWAAAARTIGLDDNLILIIKKEKEYENKIEDYKSYLNWKEKRNPERLKWEEKFGYDLKHATHLVRLLRMGSEILSTGKVQVKRIYDREELLEIKSGAWKYEQIIEYADKMEQEVKVSYQNSKLPNQPNIKYLDNLCQEIIERSL